MLPHLAALAFGIWVAQLIIWHLSIRGKASLPPQLARDHVLVLVIAHPDDESMFFVPFLHHCIRAGLRVVVVSLCDGNAAGMGRVRRKELATAARALGVRPADVHVVCDEQLQDGMHTVWGPQVVADHLAKIIAHIGGADHIATFDRGGVSGHPNHVSTAVGTRRFVAMARQASRCPMLWELESLPVWTKYLGPVFAAVTDAEEARSEDTVIAHSPSLALSWRAMQAHASQLVWFRKLWLVFSAYPYVNRVHRVRSPE